MTTLKLGTKYQEVVGHAKTEFGIHNIDGMNYLRVIIEYGMLRTRCLIEEEFYASLPLLPDGTFVRAQLKRNYVADPGAEWLILGMAKATEQEVRPFELLPVGLCRDDCLLGMFYCVDTSFTHPGLKKFLADVFADPEFGNAFVLAGMDPWKAPRAHGVFEEAVYATLRIEENPFLTIHQKEVARVAVLLNRAGRLWCGVKDPDRIGPPALRLNRQAVGWMSKNYPSIFQRLVDIWKLIDNPEARPSAYLPNDMIVAVWMALGLTREAVEPEEVD
jgi:hypothetical protein